MKLITTPIQVAEIVTALNSGDVLAYPTETSFGLGADATNETAVNKIFAIKERDPGKAVLVIVSDIEIIKPYIVWDERLTEINEKYWPGPLTVVVPVAPNSTLAPGVLSSDNCVAFRVTSHPVAREICTTLGKPLVSTSANKAGEPALFSSREILEKFASGAAPDLVIEAELPTAPASTIVKLEPNNFTILRQGSINFTL